MNAFARALALEVDRDGIAVHIVTRDGDGCCRTSPSRYAIQVPTLPGSRMAGHRRPSVRPAGIRLVPSSAVRSARTVFPPGRAAATIRRTL
jgi:hypothetical protein